jgi:Tfp pilus assembly protein PilO
MYFIPKYRVLFDRFFFLHPIVRYALTVIVLLVVGLGWRFTIYRVLSDKQHWYKDSCSTLEKQVNQVERCGQECELLQQKKEAFRVDIGQTVQTFGQGNREYTAIAFLFSLLVKHQLYLEAFIPHNIVDHVYYQTLPIQIEARGDLQAIVSFYKAVALSKTMIEISSSHIKKESDGYYRTRAEVEIFLIKKTLQLEKEAEGLGG